MKLVVPFGFYGSGNIGDEATLMGFARLLAQCEQPMQAAVASRNIAHCARVEPLLSYFHPAGRDPRRWWAKYRASAFVFAGGTPIMDNLGEWPLSEIVPQVQAAVRRGSPIGFVGIGAEHLSHESSCRIVARDIAPHVRHWSVRSERDRTRLIDYGVAAESVTVAADMAWLIEPAGEEIGRKCLQQWGLESAERIIAVNLVNENGMFGRQLGLAGAIAAALDELATSQNASILMLANEVREDASYDIATARMIAGRMKHADKVVVAPNDYFSPTEMMSIIGCCDLAVSMRYHFCLFAALQNVPFVALTRSDKVADLCWDLNWSAAIKPTDFQSSDLLFQAKEAELAIDRLKPRIVEMRRRAQRNLSALYALGLSQTVSQPSLAT